MTQLSRALERVLNTRIHDPSAGEGVAYWRARVLDVAVLIGMALGVVSLVPGVIRAVAEGNRVLLVADFAMLAAAVLILLPRRLPYRLRAGALVALTGGIGVVQLYTSGIHTAAPVWLLTGPLFGAILFGLPVALSLLMALVVVLAGQLVLGALGVLPPAVAAEAGSPRWAETATDLILISTVSSLFISVLLRGLRTSFHRLASLRAELEEDRSQLLELNLELHHEVQARKQAEVERSRLAMAVEQAEDAIGILELDGRLSYLNAAFEEKFGLDRGDALGRHFRELGLVAHERDVEDDVRQALRQAEAWTGRIRCQGPGGEWEAQAAVSAVRDEGGALSYRLAVFHDVSRETELESQLRQSQKMQAIGTFAGGIAHDFNNLLVPILGTAELLRGEVDPALAPELDDIVRSARRGKDLIAQIMAFSRGGEIDRGPLDLRAVLDDIDRLLRASLPAHIALERQLETVGPVLFSAAEAQQVVMNLCTNAFHAMRSEGGTLTLRLDTVAGADAMTGTGVTTAVPDTDAAYVRLTVEDTGEGMSRSTLNRVFEPFFTTKGDGEGTGLGLAMVHGVVRSAGGLVLARSREGAGTRIEVLLPQLARAHAAPGVVSPAAAEGRGQVVLMVDDEAPVLRVAGRFLERLGYAPRLVESGEAALAVLEAGDPVDLLVTDLTMPGMNGLALGRAARSRRPGLPMVLCSGLVDGDTLREARAAGFATALSKPFGRDELAEAVATGLDQAVVVDPRD